jgi:hypothetical protein
MRINGKVHVVKYRDGPEARRIAAEVAARRQRRLDVAEARAEIRHAVARLRRLGLASHDLMIKCGYYKVGANWRRRGVIQMNMLNKSIAVREVIKRESARRFFEQAADPDAEINRYLIDVAALHMDSLIARVTDDPVRGEATRRDIERAAAELAGPSPSALIVALARTAAMLKVEYDLASFRYMVAVDEGQDSPVTVCTELRRWRDFAHKRFTSVAKAITLIKKVELSAIETTLARLRVVG